MRMLDRWSPPFWAFEALMSPVYRCFVLVAEAGGPPGWLGSTFKVVSVLQMQLLSGGLEVVLDLPPWHMQEVA